MKSTLPPPHQQSVVTMHAALQAAEEAIEHAIEFLHSGEDGKPVDFLSSADIEEVFLTLGGVIVQIHEAIKSGEVA